MISFLESLGNELDLGIHSEGQNLILRGHSRTTEWMLCAKYDESFIERPSLVMRWDNRLLCSRANRRLSGYGRNMNLAKLNY